MVLLLVLIVIALLSLAAFSFTDMMYAEYKAAIVNQRQAQARALADSGIEFLQRFLSQLPDVQQQGGGRFDNPSSFQGVLVQDAELPRDRGRFSILAPSIDESGNIQGVRYGVEDESCKLNLNVLLVADKVQPNAGRTLLMALPGMTETAADSILDWMDADSEPREFGAEDETYLGQGYRCKNGPPDTIEELLVVQGVTPQLLFGLDANRNGIIDDNEAGGDSISAAYGAPAEADRGWAAQMTLYSVEANLQPDGTPRIDLNNSDLQALSDQLSQVFTQEWVNFIIAYRQNGPAPQTRSTGGSGGSGSGGSGSGGSGSGGSGSGGSGTSGGSASGNTANAQTQDASTLQIDLTQPAKAQFTSVLDLIGARVSIPVAMSNTTVSIVSPFADEPLSMGTYLPTLLDHVTVNKAATIPGRININRASELVLKGIPGMTEAILERLLAERQSTEEITSDSPFRHEHWLLYKQVVTLDEMKRLVPFITAGGSVYRAQVVGYFDDQGPAARLEVVINASSTTPRVVFWRDMTNLGRGFNLATLGSGAL